MATESRTIPADSPFLEGITPYRFTVRKFERILDAGILPAERHVELLDGLLVDKRPGKAAPILNGLPLYPITIAQFKSMMDAGVLTERTRVELLGGVVARQMTKQTPHNYTVGQLGAMLLDLVKPVWLVIEEKSVELGNNWRPEPDVAVVRVPRSRYRLNDPTEHDIPMVVEVAESSRSKDRAAKWIGHAVSGIAVYWLVDLSKRTIEVYTNPAGRGKAARYREALTYNADAEVPVVIEGREFGKIAVKDILP